MEDVAEHINEMQRVDDEYGHVFDELSRSRRTNDAVGHYITAHLYRRAYELTPFVNQCQSKFLFLVWLK